MNTDKLKEKMELEELIKDIQIHYYDIYHNNVPLDDMKNIFFKKTKKYRYLLYKTVFIKGSENHTFIILGLNKLNQLVLYEKYLHYMCNWIKLSEIKNYLDKNIILFK